MGNRWVADRRLHEVAGLCGAIIMLGWDFCIMAVIERWLLRSGDVAAYILRFHCIGNEFVNLGKTPMYSAKLWSKGPMGRISSGINVASAMVYGHDQANVDVVIFSSLLYLNMSYNLLLSFSFSCT